MEKFQKMESELKKNFIIITELEEKCELLEKGGEKVKIDQENSKEIEIKLKNALELADKFCKTAESIENEKIELQAALEKAKKAEFMLEMRVTELESELVTTRNSTEQVQLDMRQTLKDEEELHTAYSLLEKEIVSVRLEKEEEVNRREAAEQKVAELEQEMVIGRESLEEQEVRVRLEQERLALMQRVEELETELDNFRFERQDYSTPRLSSVLDMDKRQVITTDLLDFEDESPLYSAEKASPARMRVCKSVRHHHQIWCLLSDQSDEPDFIWMKLQDIDQNLPRPPVLDDELEDQRQEFEEKLGEMDMEIEQIRKNKDRILSILEKLHPCPEEMDFDTYIETFLELFNQPIEAVSVSEQGGLAPDEVQSLLQTIKRLETENEELEQTLQLQEQQLRLLHEEHRAKAEGETGQTSERHFAEIFANFARSLPQL